MYTTQQIALFRKVSSAGSTLGVEAQAGGCAESPKACLQQMTSGRKEFPGVSRRTTGGETPCWTGVAKRTTFLGVAEGLSNGHGRNKEKVETIWRYYNTDFPQGMRQSLFWFSCVDLNHAFFFFFFFKSQNQSFLEMEAIPDSFPCQQESFLQPAIFLRHRSVFAHVRPSMGPPHLFVAAH